MISTLLDRLTRRCHDQEGALRGYLLLDSEPGEGARGAALKIIPWG